MTYKRLNLALQGGGAHGSYTWGVLDRLLEEEDIILNAASGSSAGAMNAVILANGFRAGKHAGAKKALEAFWREVSCLSELFNPIKTTVFDQLRNGWNLDGSFTYEAFQLLTRSCSPYQFNPLNLNPLRDLLSRIVDWDMINRGGDIPLFITATSVRNGRARVFRCSQITIDVLMASASIPFYAQAVEIDGEAYWDGGYMGNPSLWPLIYHTDSKDVLLVQINPLEHDAVPKKVDEIINRLNEIVFNSGLIAEMRAINFVRKLIEDGDLNEEKYRRMNMHMIPAPDMACHLNPSSKLNTNILFFETMRDIGRKAADTWIRQNKRYIGEKSTIDIEAVFLGGLSHSVQEQEQRQLVKAS